MRSRIVHFVLFIGACALAPHVRACSVPVFRYALERWETAPYQAIVFHRGALAAQDKQFVEALKSTGEGPLATANIRVETFDLDAVPDSKQAKATAKAMGKIWAAQKDATLPWTVLLYPDGNEELPLLWSGPLKRDWIAPLVASPARTEIARKLAAGDAAVWVLLTTGEKEKDAAALKTLETQLTKLQASIALPKEEDTRGGPMVRLRSELPLKISFSVVQVSRRDPAEAMFVSMLSKMDKTFGDPAQPVAYPIFGRGRALVGLTGKQFNTETIEEATLFLTGACSCQVKELNPGVDMLFSTDWEGLLEGKKIDEEPAAPAVPLPVLPVLTQKTTTAEVPASAPVMIERRAESNSTEPNRMWLLAGAIVTGIIALASGMMLFKARGKEPRA